MPTLRAELTNRLAQLENRVMMIPRYVENNKAWSGKNHYTMDMIPPLKNQIEETKAAIAGIDRWREIKRQMKPKYKNDDKETTTGSVK
jgi:hypothetical protein